MKATLIFFFYFFAIVAVAGFTTFLMFHHIEGWGWLVFIDALLIATTVKVSDKD